MFTRSMVSWSTIATATASARSWMTTKSSSRRSGESTFESATPRMRCSGVTTTAAATTGPASGPRPASSTPATRARPARHACPSYRYGADAGAMGRSITSFGPGLAGRRHGHHALFLVARGLAGEPAEIVELRAPHLAVPHDVDLLDAGRMEGERPFDADAVGDASHRERGAAAFAALPDDDALE